MSECVCVCVCMCVCAYIVIIDIITHTYILMSAMNIHTTLKQTMKKLLKYTTNHEINK